MNYIKKWWVPISTLALGFALGVLFCFFLRGHFFPYPSGDATLREIGKYKLISPLLLCGDTKNFSENIDLEKKVNELLAKKIAGGEATDVSVYFRGNGTWMGIHEDATYTPASLLKVPIMIAYFRIAESDPSILLKQLHYDGVVDNNEKENFKSPRPLKPGWYSVDQLIASMVENSDNNATGLLVENIDQKVLSEVYSDLGLPIASDGSAVTQSISAKQYSYFFRVLYNATYLSAEYSEKALELLVRGDFSQGLRASVPNTVQVAQKFGERSVVTPQGAVFKRELHDCGFVYHSNRPYLLCIMTRGADFDGLIDIIQSVGKLVYSEMGE